MTFKKIFVLLALAFFVMPFLLYSNPTESHGTASSNTRNTFNAVDSFGVLRIKTSTSPSPQEPAPCPNCGGGGGGGGTPSTITYKIAIFDSEAKVQIDSSTYSNGQTVTLDTSSTHEIQAISIASDYSFFQWETSSGSIDNYGASQTYLNTGTSSGILSLVLNNTAITNAWAGFVQSGNASEVTGEFYIPSATYISGGTDPNVIGIWTGIGGFQTNYLWQAGVAVNVSSIGSEIITPWYEAVPAGPVYNNNIHFNPNDLVQVWTNYSNGISTFEIIDHTTGQQWGKSISFTPDSNTAEWIVEDPGQGHFTMPDYNDVTWTIASSNNGNLISPLTAITQYVGSTVSYDHFITEPNQFTVYYG